MAISKDEILDAISNLTVIELSELLTAFEERIQRDRCRSGRHRRRRCHRRRRAGTRRGGKDEFDVVLTDAGAQKIQVIKVVRELTEPRLEGGQGPRRRRAEADPREGEQGRRRGGARQARRRRASVEVK
jgi:large subunit ribosomal protein L7/L12